MPPRRDPDGKRGGKKKTSTRPVGVLAPGAKYDEKTKKVTAPKRKTPVVFQPFGAQVRQMGGDGGVRTPEQARLGQKASPNSFVRKGREAGERGKKLIAQTPGGKARQAERDATRARRRRIATAELLDRAAGKPEQGAGRELGSGAEGKVFQKPDPKREADALLETFRARGGKLLKAYDAARGQGMGHVEAANTVADSAAKRSVLGLIDPLTGKPRKRADAFAADQDVRLLQDLNVVKGEGWAERRARQELTRRAMQADKPRKARSGNDVGLGDLLDLAKAVVSPAKALSSAPKGDGPDILDAVVDPIAGELGKLIGGGGKRLAEDPALASIPGIQLPGLAAKGIAAVADAVGTDADPAKVIGGAIGQIAKLPRDIPLALYLAGQETAKNVGDRGLVEGLEKTASDTLTEAGRSTALGQTLFRTGKNGALTPDLSLRRGVKHAVENPAGAMTLFLPYIGAGRLLGGAGRTAARLTGNQKLGAAFTRARDEQAVFGTTTTTEPRYSANAFTQTIQKVRARTNAGKAAVLREEAQMRYDEARALDDDGQPAEAKKLYAKAEKTEARANRLDPEITGAGKLSVSAWLPYTAPKTAAARGHQRDRNENVVENEKLDDGFHEIQKELFPTVTWRGTGAPERRVPFTGRTVSPGQLFGRMRVNYRTSRGVESMDYDDNAMLAGVANDLVQALPDDPALFRPLIESRIAAMTKTIDKESNNPADIALRERTARARENMMALAAKSDDDLMAMQGRLVEYRDRMRALQDPLVERAITEGTLDWRQAVAAKYVPSAVTYIGDRFQARPRVVPTDDARTAKAALAENEKGIAYQESLIRKGLNRKGLKRGLIDPYDPVYLDEINELLGLIRNSTGKTRQGYLNDLDEIKDTQLQSARAHIADLKEQNIAHRTVAGETRTSNYRVLADDGTGGQKWVEIDGAELARIFQDPDYAEAGYGLSVPKVDRPLWISNVPGGTSLKKAYYATPTHDASHSGFRSGASYEAGIVDPDLRVGRMSLRLAQSSAQAVRTLTRFVKKYGVLTDPIHLKNIAQARAELSRLEKAFPNAGGFVLLPKTILDRYQSGLADSTAGVGEEMAGDFLLRMMADDFVDPQNPNAMLPPGEYIAVPRPTWDSFERTVGGGFKNKNAAIDFATLVTQQMKKTVLPFNMTFYLSNFIDNTLRTTIGTNNPAAVLTMLRSQRMLLRELNKPENQELKRQLWGGQGALASLRNNIHSDSERKIADKMVWGALQRGQDATVARLRTVNMALTENPQTAALLEKAIKDIGRDHLDRQGDFSFHSRNTLRLAGLNRMRESDAARDRAMKFLHQELGRYDSHLPWEKAAVRTFTPFLDFARNALFWVYYVMPVKHPLTTAVLTSLEAVFAEQVDAMTDEDMPEFLKGAALLDGQFSFDIARYTSFGPAAKEGPFLLAASGLGPFRTPFLAGAGVDWRGQKIRTYDEDKEKNVEADWFGRMVYALNSLAEATIPLARQGRQLREQGVYPFPQDEFHQPGAKSDSQSTLLFPKVSKTADPSSRKVIFNFLGLPPEIAQIMGWPSSIGQPKKMSPLDRGLQKAGFGKTGSAGMLKTLDKALAEGGFGGSNQSGKDPVQKALEDAGFK